MEKVSRHFKVRLLLITLLIVAVMLLASFYLTYNISHDMMQNQDRKSTLASFQKSEKSLEWFLSNVQKVSLYLQLTEPVQHFLYNEFNDSIQYTEVKQDLVREIDSIIGGYSYINAIILFKPNGEMGGSSLPRTYFHTGLHQFYLTEEYQKAAIGQTRTTWTSGYLRDYFTLYPLMGVNEKDIMIVGLRTIGDQVKDNKGSSKGEPKSGVMLVSVSEPVFRQIYDNLADEGTNISVLDKYGKQISGTKFSQFGDVPPYYEHISTENHFGSFTTDIMEEKIQIIYYRMKNTGWTLVKEIPLSIYSTNADTIRYTMLFVFIGVLFIVVIVYTLWVMRFSKPFDVLTKSMHAVGEGQLDKRINVRSEIYEIELINQAFNEMINNLNSLITENKEMEREKHELEFKNLQTQINPHFIYNTITSIRWMASLSGAENVADALISLVRLLHPVFKDNKIMWTLKEEVDYIENYIELMKLRYGSSVSFTICVWTEMEEIKLPRFILQPILENCFEHAIRTDGSLRINVTMQEDDKRLIIIIEDNGNGIDDRKLKELNSLFEGVESDNLINNDGGYARIGLNNVNKRLKLCYGVNSGLKIDSNSEGGTKLFLYIIKNDGNFL